MGTPKEASRRGNGEREKRRREIEKVKYRMGRDAEREKKEGNIWWNRVTYRKSTMHLPD